MRKKYKKRYNPKRHYRKPRNRKLTDEQVRAIRADKRRPYKVIAYDYGVGITCIWEIINKKAWKSLD